ncbi:unnamed protein product [Clonostachys solani]|uniref:AAA+ ATPase domain-containing protein n=1 Tax=Clonostachys solani TaxID=160281 RepID=A0A9N9ZKT3_9HYPO|nr:unnamed protein product [Clonostachys solani]
MASTSSGFEATESETLFGSYEEVLRARSSGQGEADDAQHTALRFSGRLFDITEHWDSHDEPGEVIPTGQPPKTAARSMHRYSEHSLLVRRIQLPQQEQRMQLEIQSSSLQHVFREITGRLHSINVMADPIIIKAPFHELYYFRAELEERRTKVANADLRQELKLFKDFENEHLSRTLNMKQIAHHQKHGTITYEYLWSIFKPHEFILLRSQITNNLTLLSCGMMQKFWINADTGEWWIQIRCMGYNGQQFGPVETNFKFQPFPGVKNIRDLPAYPLSYCPKIADIKAALLERGKGFIRLCQGDEQTDVPGKLSGCLRDYDGPVWVQRENWKKNGMEFFDDPHDTARISGRVLVDPAGFMNEKPIFREKVITSEELGRIPAMRISEFSEDELMMFPAMIAGYSLTEKHVGYFDVSSFKDVTWEREEAQHLHDTSPITRLLLNITSGFRYTSSAFGYSIQRKGQGLVLLFHERPGTGKTLTAAEYLNRPLYRVNAADMGSGIYQVEENLQSAFRRISRWNAILLLDEADALMSSRGDNTEDNTLVSGAFYFCCDS